MIVTMNACLWSRGLSDLARFVSVKSAEILISNLFKVFSPRAQQSGD